MKPPRPPVDDPALFPWRYGRILPGRSDLDRPKPTWVDWAMVAASIIAIAIIVGTVANLGHMFPDID